MRLGKLIPAKPQDDDWGSFPEEERQQRTQYVPATVQPSRRHETVRKIIQDAPPLNEPEPVEVEHV